MIEQHGGGGGASPNVASVVDSALIKAVVNSKKKKKEEVEKEAEEVSSTSRDANGVGVGGKSENEETVPAKVSRALTFGMDRLLAEAAAGARTIDDDDGDGDENDAGKNASHPEIFLIRKGFLIAQTVRRRRHRWLETRRQWRHPPQSRSRCR